MAEEWRVIPDFPNYEASSLGRIRRCVDADRGVAKAGKIKYAARFGHYMNVRLSKNGIKTTRTVHRLVCRTFHGEPPTTKHEAAHCDGNKMNNAAANLRWATHAENMEDDVKLGKDAYRRGQAKISSETVREIRRLIGERVSQRKIAALLGVSRGTVDHISRGTTWKWLP